VNIANWVATGFLQTALVSDVTNRIGGREALSMLLQVKVDRSSRFPGSGGHR
jgi:hypothetical protein